MKKLIQVFNKVFNISLFRCYFCFAKNNSQISVFQYFIKLIRGYEQYQNQSLKTLTGYHFTWAERVSDAFIFYAIFGDKIFKKNKKKQNLFFRVLFNPEIQFNTIGRYFNYNNCLNSNTFWLLFPVRRTNFRQIFVSMHP